jgi:hypothetical protein
MKMQVDELGSGARSHFAWAHFNGKRSRRCGELSTERGLEVEYGNEITESCERFLLIFDACAETIAQKLLRRSCTGQTEAYAAVIV